MEILFIIGRVLLGGFFLMSGVNHFTKFKTLCQYAKSKHVPWPGFGIIFSGIMLIAGGLGILLWQFVLISALILVVFLIFTSLTMHNFWKVEEPRQKMTDMRFFLSNIALTGALITLAALYYFLIG